MVSETGPCFSSPRPQMSNTVFCRCECLRAERSLSAHLESTPSYLYPGVGAASRDNQCGQQIQRVSGWGIEGAQVQSIRAPATPGWERELAYRQSFEFVVNDAFGGNKVEDVTLKSFLRLWTCVDARVKEKWSYTKATGNWFEKWIRLARIILLEWWLMFSRQWIQHVQRIEPGHRVKDEQVSYFHAMTLGNLCPRNLEDTKWGRKTVMEQSYIDFLTKFYWILTEMSNFSRVD